MKLMKLLTASVLVGVMLSVSLAGCLGNTNQLPVTNDATNNTTQTAVAVPVQQGTTNKNPVASVVATADTSNGNGVIQYPIGTTNHDTPTASPSKTYPTLPTTLEVLSTTPTMIKQGQSVTIKFTVLHSISSPVVGAYVVLSIRGTTIGTALVESSGYGTFVVNSNYLPLAKGFTTVSLDYAGDSQYIQSGGSAVFQLA